MAREKLFICPKTASTGTKERERAELISLGRPPPFWGEAIDRHCYVFHLPKFCCLYDALSDNSCFSSAFLLHHASPSVNKDETSALWG